MSIDDLSPDDRGRLLAEARAQVERELREFIISYFDEEFLVAFREYSEAHRKDTVSIYG
jgi:hypothetical protein